ncbi:unnamed protein product [Zymoseptoria tritici ST99CH_3D1]|uniref:Stc1 domain-containing protein n=1 Tax=Zymoseptoria tritici ST99CH_1E4 TaxID=1276532 RepID=A0A2H1H9J9_ZYMTR|nr:unnamed protein product [Zymoseptoria tritici ST99CH_1E4]SMR65037.1 unnamed protein product [Zymoseptoria tritici ST99CH_3D1]
MSDLAGQAAAPAPPAAATPSDDDNYRTCPRCRLLKPMEDFERWSGRNSGGGRAGVTWNKNCRACQRSPPRGRVAQAQLQRVVREGNIQDDNNNEHGVEAESMSDNAWIATGVRKLLSAATNAAAATPLLARRYRLETSMSSPPPPSPLGNRSVLRNPANNHPAPLDLPRRMSRRGHDVEVSGDLERVWWRYERPWYSLVFFLSMGCGAWWGFGK